MKKEQGERFPTREKVIQNTFRNALLGCEGQAWVTTDRGTVETIILPGGEIIIDGQVVANGHPVVNFFQSLRRGSSKL